MTASNDEPRFSESQLRGIIARAAQPGDPLYSTSEIHDIGAELGIDAAALDAAIASMRALERQSESRVLGFPRYTSYGITLGFIGSASLLTPGVGSFAIVALGAMLAISGVLTRSDIAGRSSSVTVFLRRNFVAWGSFIIGSTTFARLANPSWLGNESTAAGLSVAGLWIVSSIIGAVVARNGSTPADGARSDELAPPWRVRLAARLKRWVDALLLPFEQAVAAARSSMYRSHPVAKRLSSPPVRR